MKAHGQERRQFIRGDLPCKIFIYTKKHLIVSTLTDNIGQGGVKVTLEEKLEVDSKVDVEIYSDYEPTLCTGRVAWVRKHPEPDKAGKPLYDTGLELAKKNKGSAKS